MDQQREEGWRSSRRQPGHRRRIPTDDPRDKKKGKGKALAELDDGSESEEEDDSDDGGITHRNFELGSGSGARIAQIDATFKIPAAQPLISLNPSNPALLVAPNEQAVSERQEPERMEEAGLSDWAEEEPRPTMPVTLKNIRGTESIPSNWENLADNNMISEKDITEEDIRLMKELENEMILDGLLTNDDLLGE